MSDLTRWHTKNLDEWCPADWTDEQLYDELYVFAEARIAELVGNRRAEPMMLLFRPLMSTRRQGQIDKAIINRVIGDKANWGRKNREKTTCPKGHEYDVVKWEARKNGKRGIHRRCSICDKASAEARKSARNERLRERYRTDPDFRSKKIRNSREQRAAS